MPPPVPRCESPPQRVRPLPVGRVLAGKKRGHGRVKTDTPWPFSVLILRDARVLKRRAILKPFCHAISGSGQASSPRQSRKSQPFVRLPPPYSPFLSIVTPYTRGTPGPEHGAEDMQGLEDFGPACVQLEHCTPTLQDFLKNAIPQ